MINKIIYFLLFQLVSIPSFVLAREGMPAAIVQVEDAINIDIAPVVSVTGTVIGRFDSKIAAEVEGTLETVLEVGDRIEMNGVVAKIDNTKYLLALNQIQTEVRPIETMVDFFQRETNRLEILAKQNNTAKNKLDQTQTSRDELIAKVRIVKAKLAIARDILQRATVRAPFSGVVIERFKSSGERVNVGDQIIRIMDTERVEVQARIQQVSFPHVKKADKLKIKGPAGEIIGVVRTVIPVGDDVSRLYEIRVEFDNNNWLAGTAVEVVIPVKNKQNVIAVSRDALVIRQTGVFIYRINNEDKAELVPIIIGISNSSHVQVIGNVKENDKIVVRGNERLRPGQAIKIISGTVR
jgi:RND family efflux transporter MFP subunit|tara:strand:+ start:116 stop:1171 length:1056 start_codon:yes stop_codon:yes gene_type:complete